MNVKQLSHYTLITLPLMRLIFNKNRIEQDEVLPPLRIITGVVRVSRRVHVNIVHIVHRIHPRIVNVKVSDVPRDVHGRKPVHEHQQHVRELVPPS